jgi:hypothetical protein
VSTLPRGSGDPVLTGYARALEDRLDVPAIDLERHSKEDVTAARRAWGSRVLDEWRSVVVFSELLGLLGEVAAPFETLCTVQKLIADELRHAELCARVCDWLGGRVKVDLTGLGLPSCEGQSEVARAYEIVVRELILGEGESLGALDAYRRATTEPAVRAVFDVLVRDEAWHHLAGRRLADELRRAFPKEAFAEVDAELAGTLEDDLAHVRSEYQRGAKDGPGRALGASIRPEELRSARFDPRYGSESRSTVVPASSR